MNTKVHGTQTIGLRDGTDYCGLDYLKYYSWRGWALKDGPPPVIANLVLNEFYISPGLAAQVACELNFLGTIGQSVKYVIN